MVLRNLALGFFIVATGILGSTPTAGQTPLQPDPLAFVAPSRDVDVIHTQLELDLDLRGQRISGTVTHTLRPLKPNLETFRLNCVGLNIEAVTINGRNTDYEYPVSGDNNTSWIEGIDSREASEEIVVHLANKIGTDESFDVTIRYDGEPKQGLYFVAPEKGIPEKRYEVWSQGEGEDNRYWIPCFDYPNDKATFDGVFTVERGHYVLSNGVLVDKKDEGDKTRFHWRLDTPQVSYLMMVAAGDYKVVEEKWRDIPLLYVVPPGTDDEYVKNGYGRTKDMMEFFSNYIGIDYPFKKYAQVVVQNFIYGGMENTTATVMNMRTLFGEQTASTHTEDGLVAHELAHQWWGDMVTCSEWSHLWLNEGFATYFQMLYREHAEGDDAFRYNVNRQHETVIERDGRDARPIVVDFFNRKDGRNSANVYRKGSSVLHMLRFIIGDELFAKSMREYGERYKYKVAQTSDFVQVVKETTGENLDWFFEQWVYLTGHPKLKAAKHWDADTQTLNISIRQTQEVAGTTPLFRLPMDIEITTDDQTSTHRFVIDKESQDFYFQLASKPRMVIIDKGDWTLKTLDFPKTSDEFLYQLKHGTGMDRTRALRGLAKKKSKPKVVDALYELVADSDEYWEHRREAALALGSLKSDPARDALLRALETNEARVRLAIVEGLGDHATAPSIDRALAQVFGKDRAFEVQAAAVASLVKNESPDAKKICLQALRVDSYRDVIRNAGINGVVELDATDALGKIKALAKPGQRRTHRHTAISGYAKLAKTLDKDGAREDAADFLADMLGDWYVRTRQSVIGALQTLGETDGVEPLRQVAINDPIANIRSRATKAANAIETGSAETMANKKLQGEIKELSSQLEELKKELGALKAKLPESREVTGSVSTKGRGSK